jgi:hypothetical protein
MRSPQLFKTLWVWPRFLAVFSFFFSFFFSFSSADDETESKSYSGIEMDTLSTPKAWSGGDFHFPFHFVSLPPMIGELALTILAEATRPTGGRQKKSDSGSRPVTARFPGSNGRW